MRKTPLPKPKQKVILVEHYDAHVSDLRTLGGYWVFGPRTTYKWPSGDFHYGTNNRRIGESAGTMQNLLSHHNVVIYDPDLCMDEGL